MDRCKLDNGTRFNLLHGIGINLLSEKHYDFALQVFTTPTSKIKENINNRQDAKLVIKFLLGAMRAAIGLIRIGMAEMFCNERLQIAHDFQMLAIESICYQDLSTLKILQGDETNSKKYVQLSKQVKSKIKTPNKYDTPYPTNNGKKYTPIVKIKEIIAKTIQTSVNTKLSSTL